MFDVIWGISQQTKVLVYQHCQQTAVVYVVVERQGKWYHLQARASTTHSDWPR